MTWPTVILWLLVLAGALSRGPLILYLFSSTVIFGGLTMAPPGLTGGLNVPAQTVCAAILIGKIMLRSDNLAVALRHMMDVRKLGLLAFFGVYILVTAVLYPRLFGGEVGLFSLNQADKIRPLEPTSANFTQTMYLLISVAITISFGMASRNANFRRHYIRSILLAGIMLFGSGLVDLALDSTGHSSLLTPFHNASYNLLDTESLGGQHRVVGLMPEASVYGQACVCVLSFLVFNFRYFEAHLRRRVVPLLILAMAVITFLSTSSTGYVGLIALILLAVGRLGLSLLLVRLRTFSQFRRTVTIVSTSVAVAGVVVLFGPYFLTKYNHLLDTVLLSKTTSASYLERSSWTLAGWNAFLATHGVGVGVGSVRTSNWFVNILASSGVVGVALLFGFYAKMMLPFKAVPSAAYRHFANSLKFTILPAVVMTGISGTTPDPGVWMMSLFGLLYGLRLRPQVAEAVDSPVRSGYDFDGAGEAGLVNS